MESLLEPSVVGETIEVSQATLRHWPTTGQGPAFLKVGRQIRYPPSAIEAWLQDHGKPPGEPT